MSVINIEVETCCGLGGGGGGATGPTGPTGATGPTGGTGGTGGGGGGGGSSLNFQVAYVDASGDDGTAVLGDAGLPFLTIQAAIDAIEVDDGGNDGSGYQIYIGNNNLASEDLTTDLQNVRIIGDASINCNSGNSLTFADSGACSLLLKGTYIPTVTATNAVIMTIQLQDAFIDTIAVPAGQVSITAYDSFSAVGDVTADSTVNMYYVATIYGDVTSSGGSAVTIKYCNNFPGTITSNGGDIYLGPCAFPSKTSPPFYNSYPSVNADFGNVLAVGCLLNNVTDVSELRLVDARVLGTNGADGTVNQDVYGRGVFSQLVTTLNTSTTGTFLGTGLTAPIEGDGSFYQFEISLSMFSSDTNGIQIALDSTDGIDRVTMLVTGTSTASAVQTAMEGSMNTAVGGLTFCTGGLGTDGIVSIVGHITPTNGSVGTLQVQAKKLTAGNMTIRKGSYIKIYPTVN